jgi:peroxiredoxin
MKHLIHAAVVAAMTLASTVVLAADLKAAPDFKAKDANGKEHSLADYKGKVLVLEFTNAGSPVSGKGGCPFMVPRYEKQVMQKVADKVATLGGTYLAVNSNHYNTAEDTKEIAKKYDVKFDTLLDSDGAVGKALGAKTTPHMFVINKEGKIVYDGALNDNASPDITKDEAATNYVVQAVEAASKGEVPKVTQTKPYGCGIKYKE